MAEAGARRPADESGRSQGIHHRQRAGAWLRHVRGPPGSGPRRRLHPRAGRGVPDADPGAPVRRGHRGHRGPRRGLRPRHQRPHRGRPAEGADQRPGPDVPEGDRQGPAAERRAGGGPGPADRGRRALHRAPAALRGRAEVRSQGAEAGRGAGLGDPRPPADRVRQGRGDRPREDRQVLPAQDRAGDGRLAPARGARRPARQEEADRGEPPAGRLDRQALRRPRHAVPGPDPGRATSV